MHGRSDSSTSHSTKLQAHNFLMPFKDMKVQEEKT